MAGTVGKNSGIMSKGQIEKDRILRRSFSILGAHQDLNLGPDYESGALTN